LLGWDSAGGSGVWNFADDGSDSTALILAPFDIIQQKDIVVDESTNYTLTVQARMPVSQGEVDALRLYENPPFIYQDFPLAPVWTLYDFDLGMITSPATIGIAGLIDGEIQIRYACLHPTTISTNPGSCYFNNNEFDADGAGWGDSATTFASGQAFMGNNSAIFQDAHLLTNEDSSPHEYMVSAQVRLIATGDYSGQVDKSAFIEYEFPDGDGFNTLGTVDSALVLDEGLNLAGTVVLDHAYQFQDTFEISETTDGVFTFKVETSDTENFILGLRVDWVCIAGPFPGQSSGPYQPPFIAGCAVVPLPLDDSIGPWIYFHWKNLERFFNCDLMILLNKWFSLFNNFQLTVRYVMRWWLTLTHYGGGWLQGVVWWLDGNFRNIAVGQVTTITPGDSGCHDVFCAVLGVVDTLANTLTPIVNALGNAINALVAILIGAANFFFTILGGIITFILAIIVKIFAFIQSALSLFTALINSYNTASPTTIPGLPACASDPDSSLLCRGVWVLDNTIMGGRWGILFTIILAILSIHLVLWAIGEFRNMILKVGQST
jgi:hypothetical protein